jgi:hypothetical protein
MSPTYLLLLTVDRAAAMPSAGDCQDGQGAVAPPATVDVLRGWIYLIGADSCVQAQTLAGVLLAKTTT